MAFRSSVWLASQVVPSSSSAFVQGRMISAPRPAAARCSAQRLVTHAAAAQAERFRLNNLSPQEGSRRKEKRKGRGYGSGQVWTRPLAGCSASGTVRLDGRLFLCNLLRDVHTLLTAMAWSDACFHCIIARGARMYFCDG